MDPVIPVVRHVIRVPDRASPVLLARAKEGRNPFRDLMVSPPGFEPGAPIKRSDA